MKKTSPLFRLLKMETVHSKQPDESADPMHALSRAQIPPSLLLLTPATQANALSE